ncbi:MAG: hypothetical protein FWE60_00040 [Oscillospiraceae bacterium]|nr:hypothetical protein [Oscillospiraceae bacterium]
MEHYELKKAFESIEPGEAVCRKMLDEILEKHTAKTVKPAKMSRSFSPVYALTAVMLVLCVGGFGFVMMFGSPGGEYLPGADGSLSTGFLDDLDEIPEGYELITASYNGVRELVISPIGDIMEIRSADIDEVQISFYGLPEDYSFFIDGEYSELTDTMKYSVDVPFETNRTVYFSGMDDYKGVSIVYVTLPRNAPFERIYINATNNVWIEDVTAGQLYVRGRENADDAPFMLTILNSHFNGASISEANADIHVLDSSFSGTQSNVVGAVGFFYKLSDNTETREIKFRNSKATGLLTHGANIAVDVFDSELESFQLGEAYNDDPGQSARITDSRITLLTVQNIDSDFTFTNGRIDYVVVMPLIDRDDVQIMSGSYVLNNFKILHSDVGSYAVAYEDNSGLWFNIITGEEQEGVRLNTELLDEFGMTLAELEEKYGTATRGEFESMVYYDVDMYIYYFEGGFGGYVFMATEDETEGVLSDGTPRVGEIDSYGYRIEFISFINSPINRLLNTDGARADDLFLGITGSISVEELKRTPGVEIAVDTNGNSVFYSYYTPPICPSWGYPDGHSGFWETGFWQGENFSVSILHETEDVIEPDSQLFLRYYPHGGRQ